MADEKLTITALKKALNQSTGAHINEAQSFIDALLQTITRQAKAGETIRITGLGSFRMQWNAPRKSVNIRTGEEIQIDGYYKMVFTPENELQDRINEPFLHLNPLDIAPEGQEQTSPEAEINTTPQQLFNEQAELIKDLLTDMGEIKEEQTITEMPVERTETPVESNNTIIVNNTTPENTNAPEEPKKRNKRTWLIALITILIFLLLLAGAYFFFEQQITEWADTILHKQRTNPELIENTNAQQDNSNNALHVEGQEDGEETDELSQLTDNEPLITDGEELQEEEEEVVEDEYLAIEPLTKKSSLAKLARKYYGNAHYWVYIYLANQDQIPNPNNVPEGTMIRVPKLTPAQKDLNKAIHLEDEIFAPYL